MHMWRNTTGELQSESAYVRGQSTSSYRPTMSSSDVMKTAMFGDQHARADKGGSYIPFDGYGVLSQLVCFRNL